MLCLKNFETRIKVKVSSRDGVRRGDEGEYQTVKREGKERKKEREGGNGIDVWKDNEKKGPGIIGFIREERESTKRRGRKKGKRKR